jgi:hypothetical protein
MIDKLIEIGRCYGMEMNVGKTKVMRISRQPFPVKIVIDQKFEGGSSKSHYVESWLWKRLWTCRKTDY